MAKLDAPLFDAPIPGMSLTHELGARPWQNPPQYNTVEEALDYYIPRLQSPEVTEQLIDVLEMGMPVTTIANTMQLSGVMEGKHTIDVGMLILPVLTELIMLVGDSANIEYTSGLEKEDKLRSSLIDKATQKFRKSEEKPEENDELKVDESVVKQMKEAADKQTGLMSRRGV